MAVIQEFRDFKQSSCMSFKTIRLRENMQQAAAYKLRTGSRLQIPTQPSIDSYHVANEMDDGDRYESSTRAKLVRQLDVNMLTCCSFLTARRRKISEEILKTGRVPCRSLSLLASILTTEVSTGVSRLIYQWERGHPQFEFQGLKNRL